MSLRIVRSSCFMSSTKICNVVRYDQSCVSSSSFTTARGTYSDLPDREASYLPDREASLIKKEYCRCGSHPLQVISSRARPYLLRERAALAPFSRISGVGHSGSWPPLHCGDSKHLAPEVVPGASFAL